MNSKVWIWGLGHGGKVAVRYYDRIGEDLAGIIDNNEKLENEYLWAIPDTII